MNKLFPEYIGKTAGYWYHRSTQFLSHLFYADNESENIFFLSFVVFEWFTNLDYFVFVLEQEGSGN
jgi:hypothetical protein